MGRTRPGRVVPGASGSGKIATRIASGGRDDQPVLTGRELKCVEYLVAMESRVWECGEALRERLRLVPNGWRQFRLLCTVLDGLLEDIYPTVPLKGRLYLQNIMKHGEVLIRYVPTSRPPEWKMVKDEDLAVIINTAMAAECAICLKSGSEIRKCALRRAMEDIAPPANGHPAGRCGYTDVTLSNEYGDYMRRDGT